MPRIALLAVALVFIIIPVARAQAPCDDETTPTGWAWAQIRADQIADFGKRCGELDPHSTIGWDDPCRQIPPQFLADVLTISKWRDRLLRPRVRLRGAYITGTLDLTDAEIMPEVWIDASRIEGGFFLSDSHWKRLLSVRGSVLAGGFIAWRMRTENALLLRDHAAIEGDVSLGGASLGDDLDMSGSSFAKVISASGLNVAGSLLMNHASFKGVVNLNDAKIGQVLDMSSSSFAKDLTASRLNVGGSLFMKDDATFDGELNLTGTRIGSNLEMESSSFAKTVNGDGISVGSSLIMRDHARFKGEIKLTGARIGDTLEMSGSSFAKDLLASRLYTGGSLFMKDKATFEGKIILTGAKIGSNLEMDTSSFFGEVKADPVTVGGNLFMRNGATFHKNVSLIGAKVGGNVHLWGSSVWHLDLSGIDAHELLLNGLGWWCADTTAPAMHWSLHDRSSRDAKCGNMDSETSQILILRNAHVDAFQDSDDAWPIALDLEGFHYDRLGGLGGRGRDDMRARSPADWTEWLARDATFSTQPYTQLSTVLATAGYRDTADAIQLTGRERERREAWNHNRFGHWARLTILSYVAGYGIGLYTFFVLLWVVGLTVFGADILWYSPSARRRGLFWRLGASLHRLLPIVELSKEFKDFFDNPPVEPGQARNLNRFQSVYFAAHALAGWILGLFLAAAMGGLTQKV